MLELYPEEELLPEEKRVTAEQQVNRRSTGQPVTVS